MLKNKSWLAFTFFIFALLFFPGNKIFAAENQSEISINVQQILEKQQSFTVSYHVESFSKGVLPTGLNNEGDFQLTGNSSQGLHFTFEQVGNYIYELTPKENSFTVFPKGEAKITLAFTTYYNREGNLETMTIIEDSTGFKLPQLLFHPTRINLPSTGTSQPPKKPGHGSLPQTGETITFFTSILGLFLLVSASFLKKRQR